jgi:hypothetical protein
MRNRLFVDLDRYPQNAAYTPPPLTFTSYVQISCSISERTGLLILSTPRVSSLHTRAQGNAAFKAGDYPAAIGHYTRALLADGSGGTFALSRAAAYLKLGKCGAFSALCLRVLTRGAQARRCGAGRRPHARRGAEERQGALPTRRHGQGVIASTAREGEQHRAF